MYVYDCIYPAMQKKTSSKQQPNYRKIAETSMCIINVVSNGVIC